VLDSVVFPPGHEFVDGSMKGLSTEARRAPERISCERDAVRERRGTQDAEPFRDRSGDAASDDDVRPDREMRAVLLESTNGEDQTRSFGEDPGDFRPGQLVECV